MRIGAKKKPFYRIVVVHERSKRTGGYVELLGTYNPLTEPKDIKINKERMEYWTKQGAQPSAGYLRIIGKAPQRPPRKPKKEAKNPSPAAEAPATETPIATESTQEEPIAAESPATEQTEELTNENIEATPTAEETTSETLAPNETQAEEESKPEEVSPVAEPTQETPTDEQPTEETKE